MQDQNESDQQSAKKRGYIPARCVSFIQKLYAQNDKSTSDNNKTNSHDTGIFVATVFIALAAVLSFGAALIQAWIFNGQLGEMKTASELMKGQLEEIKRQSTSAERSSTAGRAYLFVSVPTPNIPIITALPDGKSFVFAANFSIENFGQTPAVVTKFETHTLITKTDHFLLEAPEPGSSDFLDLQENFKQPAMSLRSDFLIFIEEEHQHPLVIPANSKSIPLRQNFLFRRPPPTAPIEAVGQGAWFYCVIGYKDIFGFERENVYYVGMFGSGLMWPKNPAYNHWN